MKRTWRKKKVCTIVMICMGNRMVPSKIKDFSGFQSSVSVAALAWFCIASLSDWLPKFAQLFQPMRSKTNTNHDLLARISVPALCAGYV